MEKQERMVVHLELDGNNFYYGNLRALTDAWNKDILGVSYNYLKNYNISPEKPYKGKNCTIRKGILQTSTRKTKYNYLCINLIRIFAAYYSFHTT